MDTMKAAIATGFGDIDQNIHLRENWPVPKLPQSVPQNGNKKQATSRFMLIKVLACALAPGDVRILSGKTSYVQLPESGHPYVPGSDVCGIVTQVQDDETKFKIGDRVVSRFDEPKPVGGLAEYRLVKTELSERAPKSLTAVECCGLPASSSAARVIVEKFVKQGDRVLILGGSGGVGTALCQYTKLGGASFVAATSTATELVKSLGVDQVIDYRTKNWWEMPEFQGENKFDIVFDLVNGENWEKGGCSGRAVKTDGAYVALLAGVETEMVAQGPLDMAMIVFSMVGRILWARINPFVPKWVAPEALELKDGYLKKLFEDYDTGRVKVILDPSSPFPFTEKGVRDAFRLQKSIHAHGKVVVKIADEGK